jgi:hypothetical protein
MRHNHYKLRIGYVYFTIVTEQTDDKTDNEISTYIGQSCDSIQGCDLSAETLVILENEIKNTLNLSE